MADKWPLLSAVTFLPLLGALFIFAIRANDEIAIRNARYVALWTTVITFLLSLLVWIRFDPLTAEFQFVDMDQDDDGNTYLLGRKGGDAVIRKFDSTGQAFPIAPSTVAGSYC